MVRGCRCGFQPDDQLIKRLKRAAAEADKAYAKAKGITVKEAREERMRIARKGK